MITYLLPDIMAFALPAATLIAVVLGFLRLSIDSEIIALKSCGISLYHMLPPVAFFSIACMVLAVVISFAGVPWGNSSFKELILNLAESKANLGIKERTFCEPFDNVVFYVNRFSEKNNVMKNVFVVDRREEDVTNTIIAERGKIFVHSKDRVITLRFKDGTVFAMEKDIETGRTVKFKTYDLNINLKDVMARLTSKEKKPKEMWAGELIQKLKEVPRGEDKYNEMMIELLEKGSLPLAVLLMGIIGIPLGAQLRTRGRSSGIGISLAVFLVYYLCLAGARGICESGTLPPVIGVWIPDLFLLVACLYLLRRVANERPVNMLPAIFKARRTV
jgi:lipopolysaccharide export system permease protein